MGKASLKHQIITNKNKYKTMNTDKNNAQLPQSSVIVSAFLNGKSKQDFKKWYQNRLSVMTYSEILNINDLTVYLSLIIEWFDLIELYIKIYPHLGGGQVVFYPSFIYLDEKYNENVRNVLFDNGELYYSSIRQEAVFEAVKKANDFYNMKFFEAEH